MDEAIELCHDEHLAQCSFFEDASTRSILVPKCDLGSLRRPLKLGPVSRSLLNGTSVSLTFGITPKYGIGYGEELLSSGLRSTASHGFTAEKPGLRIAERFFKDAVVLRFLCRLRLLRFSVRGC